MATPESSLAVRHLDSTQAIRQAGFTVYIDPGAGSILMQVLGGALLAWAAATRNARG